MKLSSRLFKTFTQSSHQGFTLVELLAAASLTSVVVGTAFFGLLSLLNVNIKSNANSTLSYDVNRSMEFISDEVKMAYEVKADAAEAIKDIADFTLPVEGTPILVLSLANGKNVVYYSQPATQPWGGEKVIVRWGPNLDENGQYDETTLNTPSAWHHSVFMDYIASEPVDDQICPPTWRLTNPDSTKGFYTCVPDSGNRLVQLSIAAVAGHVTGADSDYSVTTNASTRIGDSSTRIGDGSPPGEFSCTGNHCEVKEDAKLTFEFLGTQLTCGAGGDSIPVTAEVTLESGGTSTVFTLNLGQPLVIPTVAKGTKIDIKAIAQTTKGTKTAKGRPCKYSREDSTAYNSPYIETLSNGGQVPNYKPFDNQGTINSLVSDYIQDGKINLPKNEVIYLFELGTRNKSSDAYDLQDAIIKASISNP